ncbi:outer membrane receptor protein involved in Fe transport [Pedobacter nutrimenti]|uniref:Outer membrane receptor protein involved in Fe transport n=2 Tax=Pedobacter nutrimenti TaxID=1241337 RepID=A0A318UB27_9SPHI|nr:outer membrane receptor protein involved in Fe transport [Pedobacter nutrimenti]
MQLNDRGQMIFPGSTLLYKNSGSCPAGISRLFMMSVLKVVLLVWAVLHAAETKAQQQEDVKISLNIDHLPLKEVLRRIESLTPFKFMGKAEDIEKEKDITLHLKEEPVIKALEAILLKRNFQLKRMGKNIILKKGQGKNVLSGTVKSAKTGETILNATISVLNSTSRTSSNEYGFYSLRLAQGQFDVVISAIGYRSKTENINLEQDLNLNILLEEEVKELEEVTITSENSQRNLLSPQMGVERLSMKEVKNIPVLFGEKDILKTIQLLPGIKSAGDGNSGFYVRGGGSDQNLILLDEAPVYNASHLLGFFSAFNSDAIKNVTVYKGGMPANYGGRLSSVVDIKMNDGNSKKFGLSGGIGLIASRINIEGPIQKDQSSFLFSARRTYADLFLKLSPDSNLRKIRLYFYDINAKANYIFGDKDRLYLSGYFGHDALERGKKTGIDWGNTTATLRWNHLFGPKLFSNTSLIFSNYQYQNNVNGDGNNYNIFSQIRDWNLKEEMQWNVSPKNALSFGFNVIHHTIKPGEISSVGEDKSLSTTSLAWRYAFDNALFVSNVWKPSEKFNLTYGLRLSSFAILGKGPYYDIDGNGKILDTLNYGPGQLVKNYLNLEPRVAASYQLNEWSSVKASYGRNTQNMHLISNSTSSSPTDKWLASTNNIKPEIADQWSVGYYRDLKDHKYELSIESYYKDLKNQIDYRNGADIFTNKPIETQLLYGIGRSYGIEFQLKKKTGRLTGWISYTLSKSERKIDGINNNQWYNARQDRTHDIAIVAIYALNEKWTLSANWVFYTGDAVTFPNGKYKVDDDVYFYYTNKNAYRLPNYHRLDLGATRQLRKRKNYSSELTFSLYNAYGHQNPYQTDFRRGKFNHNITEAVEYSFFRFIPSVSYNFKF